MGLFEFIGGKIQQAQDETKKAEMEAERWRPEKICNALQSTSSITKTAGYAKELKNKARDMSEYELKNLFDYAWNKRNIKACSALYPIMEEEGLCYKDENGKIRRNY